MFGKMYASNSWWWTMVWLPNSPDNLDLDPEIHWLACLN